MTEKKTVISVRMFENIG